MSWKSNLKKNCPVSANKYEIGYKVLKEQLSGLLTKSEVKFNEK